jgi:multisubunit Na+/H+ antiporter MnhG subunit
MTEWLSGGLQIAGATLALLASIGVLRMPDVFTRIAAFMVLTTAVGAHVIARAAALGGAPLWKGTIVDERPTDADGLPDDAVSS